MALSLGEIAASYAWLFRVDDQVRQNVEYLCGDLKRTPSTLANTFWHHTPNPARTEINAHGTKGADFDLDKPPGELRVVTLGDSTVEGVGLPVEATLAHYLEAGLREALAGSSRYPSVRVINAGVASHNSAFNLAYLAFRLLHFHPDVVVIKSSYNDYLPYAIPGMGIDYTHAFPMPFTLAPSPNPYWRLARHSYGLKLLGATLFRHEVYSLFQGFYGVITPAEYAAMDFAPNRDRFFVYAEHIRSMILLCKGRGIQVLVLDLPLAPDAAHFGAIPERPYRSLIAHLEEELARVTREEGVPFVATAPLAREHFTDHCHNTPLGNQVIAGRAAAALLAALPR